jgi:hypothetical protein
MDHRYGLYIIKNHVRLSEHFAMISLFIALSSFKMSVVIHIYIHFVQSIHFRVRKQDNKSG